MTLHMLTTVDNPFNPFTDYDDWYAFDARLGYDTPSLLARVARTSHDLSQADNDEAIEQAIEEIISLNPTGMHRKVSQTE